MASSSEYKDPTAEKVPSDGEYAQTKEYVRNRYFLFVNVGTKHFYSVERNFKQFYHARSKAIDNPDS